MAVKILYYRTLTDTNCVSPVRQIKPLMKTRKSFCHTKPLKNSKSVRFYNFKPFEPIKQYSFDLPSDTFSLIECDPSGTGLQLPPATQYSHNREHADSCVSVAGISGIRPFADVQVRNADPDKERQLFLPGG